MNPGLPTTLGAGRDRRLREELRAFGASWSRHALDGSPLEPASDADEPLAALVRSAPAIRRTIASFAGAADAADAMGEPYPGLFAFACATPGRRADSLGVAVVPTPEFLDAPHLPGLCGAAGLDLAAFRAALAHRPLPTRGELPRLAALVRLAYRQECELDRERTRSESVGTHLSESYEEMHLLYTLVANMAVGGEPAAFLGLVGNELLETLPFAWVAIALRAPFDRFVGGDGLAVFGSGGPDRASLQEVVGARLASDDDSALLAADDPALRAGGLAGPILACPVRRDARTLGVLLAGGAPDRGATVSNVELKLAEAAAGHLAIYLENASLFRDLDAMFLGTLEALTAAIDAKDPYTRGHSQRVSYLASELARALGLPEATVKQVRIAGLVHDIGKIGVPEATLRKAERLDDAEFAQVRRHPEIGWRILRDIPQMRDMLDGVLSHHERWDGRGYPHGLAGESIPLVARLIALADTFDAMSSNRTYRQGRDRATVLAELRRSAGTQFDPALVPAFTGLDFTGFDRMIAGHLAGRTEDAA